MNDTHEMSILHYLQSDNPTPEGLNKLIKMGGDMNQTDFFGCSPIHHVSYEGRLDLLKVLIMNKDDIDKEDLWRRLTPFFYACEMRRTECIEYLLICGCNTDIVDKEDYLDDTIPKSNQKIA